MPNRPNMKIELPDAALLDFSEPSSVVDTGMESPQEVSLADDLYISQMQPPSATEDSDPTHRVRNLSIISIPLSITEGINISADQTAVSASISRKSSLVDVMPAPQVPVSRRPSMIEPDPPLADDGAAFESGDVFPEYTLASPPKAKPASPKLTHTRASSSLQEPDMAALLARLEIENNALAEDPKSGIAAIGAHTGPNSAFEYNIRGTICSSLATLVIPDDALGMTPRAFWALVTDDYKRALTTMPTMTPLMIHKGIPASLRSAVWVGITGASDPALQLEFDSLTERLQHEQPPNESIINKDLARCFPQHETFKDVDGEGQKMLGHVLKAYSLYDPEIGYCQGMAFVVGVLLLNMPAKDAFCVFVRLMEAQSLRTMYTHTLEGLHSRTFQLKHLLGTISPDLLDHMSGLGVELAYISQWFMTMFATTCPFNILFRLYDVILAEGADETIMRVAIALIANNEERIMAMTELEDVLTLLLGRSLWAPYVQDPDFLIDEVARLCNVVTALELRKLHQDFLARSGESGTVRSLGFTSGLAGLKFFDGWLPTKRSGRSPSVSIAADVSGHQSQRSASKQSIISIDSFHRGGTDSLLSSAGTSSTFPTDLESLAENDTRSVWKTNTGATSRHADDSHSEQIEGLLLALTEVQREAAQTAASLQQERVKKESMTEIVYRLKDLVTQREATTAGISKGQRRQTMPSRTDVLNQAQNVLHELNKKSAAINAAVERPAVSSVAQDAVMVELKDSMTRLCALLDDEPNTPDLDNTSPLQGRKGSLPRTNTSLKLYDAKRASSNRMSSIILESDNTTPNTVTMDHLQSPSYFPEATIFDNTHDYSSSVPPEHKLHQRSSSLAASQAPMCAEDIPTEDAILMELVNSKTREATAIHERDEMKAELDKMRKVFEIQQVNSHHLGARLSELERRIVVEREAHTAELGRTLATVQRRASRSSARQLSIAPPVLEPYAERSNSLWPSEPSESRSGSVVTNDGSQSAGLGPAVSWWWSKNKQRSVSTGNAGPI